MTSLSIYHEDGTPTVESTSDFTQIQRALSEQGIQIERWQASAALAEDADSAQVQAAYRDSIDTLNARYNFKSIDVVSLQPDNPSKAEFRQKFLAEHTHADFEMRFFVAGRGLFYLHLGEMVYLVLCEKGDLICVPAGTAHWFDMGENPSFTCIRLFTTEAGWVGDFTGSEIAKKFPDFDHHIASLS